MVLRGLQSFFEERISPLLGGARAEAEVEHRLRLATAALFVEMMRADFEVTADERHQLEELVSETLELDPGETRICWPPPSTRSTPRSSSSSSPV